MKTPEKKVWVLLDERQGNTNQSLGVAEALGLPFETKRIEFTPLIKLPNFIINRHAFGINGKSLAELKSPWPDIVIATARRLAAVATYIKARHPETFLAQIQWPTFPSGDFDLIAAPLHDKAPDSKNVMITIGAPHRVTDGMLKKEGDKWRGRLANLPSPKVSLLVGGSSHKRDFARQHASKLAKLSSDFVNSLGGSLLITTSRRTSREIVENLTANLTCPFYLHDWQNSDESENPYFAFLDLGDAIIATGDSVSMCSEAASTGKPVYIYSRQDFTTIKYRDLHQELYKRGYARTLEDAGKGLFSSAGKLNDSLDIANEIKKRLGIK